MNRSVVIALSATALLLLVIFTFVAGDRDGVFDWRESYRSKSKSPYGTSIIHSLLSNYHPDKDFNRISKSVADDLPPHPEGGANYVFIGEASYLDSADRARIVEFVNNGNNAFFSSKTIPHDLMFYVYFSECYGTKPWNDYQFIQDTMVNMDYLHRDLDGEKPFDYKYYKSHKTRNYRWSYIDSAFFCNMEAGFNPLGYMEDRNRNRYYNFAMVHYADMVNNSYDPTGRFFFHTNPIAFSNYHLMDTLGKAYAERIFSHLSDGDIYWDSYSKVAESFGRTVNRRLRQEENMSISNETPLVYILGNRHLSWAWYSMLGLGALYLMFRAKRRQRIIPVKDVHKNTSLEFISTIGGLYYNNKNHRKLCEQKMKMFLSFVRNRYAVSTKKLDDKFVTILSKRSSVPESHLKEILKYYSNIKRSTYVSDETLKSFHKEMELIYKLCK